MLMVSEVEVRAGARLLLSPVSFPVNPGDKIGLVGRNGAGKTTLTRILAGEALPAAGTITRTGQVGYLPQDPRTGDLEVSTRDRILSARGLDQVRRRVELARILFSGADTLLLDEPTNHLDADSVVWLRAYLRDYSGGIVIISHDVGLLEAVVTKVFHLDANRAEMDQYSMGWVKYLAQRETDEKRRKRERANAARKADQLMAQADKMRAKATKAVAAQNMAKRAERLMAGVEAERASDRVAKIRFPAPAPCGKTPLSGTELSKSYGSLEVFTDVDLTIDRGSKVVVLGLNGAGKTTLLRVLSGVEAPDTGRVVAGHGLKLGYYAQEHETLDVSRSVLQNMMTASPDLNETDVRKVLGSFLFTGDDVEKPARVLSGGEKTRLALAMLVVSAANVLLLDEPTNNLDPASRAEVLAAINAYPGAMAIAVPQKYLFTRSVSPLVNGSLR